MAYKTSSYSNVQRCQNCESIMSHRESFGGYEVMTCYQCDYTIDRRGSAAYHIREIRAEVTK